MPTAHPTIGVLGYGSLLHPEALADLFADWETRTTPVTLDGFRRRFDQVASWRDTDAQHRAVLNVTRDADAWCNAVYVTDLTRGEYQTYRDRERGYRLIEVRAEHIAPYDGTCPDDDLVLLPVGERTASDIVPVPDYRDRCLAGAAHWGEQFAADFRATTETAAGIPLTDTSE